MKTEEAKVLVEHICNEIEKYFKANNLQYAVYGISGGIDSAIIAGLFARLKSRVGLEIVSVPVWLSCESSLAEYERAIEVMNCFHLDFLQYDLTPQFHSMASNYYSTDQYFALEEFLVEAASHRSPKAKEGILTDLKTLPRRKLLALGNLKARLRMCTLYHLASKLGRACVISTDNYSELCTSFWTLHGDVGDFSPIQFLLKEEVRGLAKAWKDFPQSVLDAAPTDGLGVIPGGTDENQFGGTYEELGNVIKEMDKLGIAYNQLDKDNKIKLLNHLDKLDDGLINEDGPWANAPRLIDKMCAGQFKHKLPVNISREAIGLPPIGKLKLNDIK